MSASLIYHWRRGLLSAVAGGRVFQLPTDPAASSGASWEKVQELRPGKVTLWDHCFEIPHAPSIGRGSLSDTAPTGSVTHRIGIEPAASGKLEVYDYPGKFAQRFDGVDVGQRRTVHQRHGKILYVGGTRGGIHIHGQPPCHLEACVVVRRQWDELFAAIGAEKELSFSIER
jgi:hypothetical protein